MFMNTPVPEGQTNVAQRFSAGKSRQNDPSPERTIDLICTFFRRRKCAHSRVIGGPATCTEFQKELAARRRSSRILPEEVDRVNDRALRWVRELKQKIQKKEVRRRGLPPLGSRSAAAAMGLATITRGLQQNIGQRRLQLRHCMMARHHGLRRIC